MIDSSRARPIPPGSLALGVDYFMVLEADVTPIRPNWLTLLYAHLPPQAARFWVKVHRTLHFPPVDLPAQSLAL